MKPFRLSRRALLRGAGTAIALPTLDAMLDGRGRWLGVAKAATTTPVRVMAFHFPHGVVLPEWTPTTEGKGWAMTRGLAPLLAFQDDINVVSGLNLTVASRGPGGGHAQGMPAFATGMAGNGAGASGPSFDQVLAAELGMATKFRSLVANNEAPGTAAEQATTAHMNNISWTGPGAPSPCERDPQNFFMTLVSAIPAGAAGATPAGPSAEVLATIKRRKSVLDHVMAEVDGLSKKVGSTDRRRLDEHLTGLREVERVLTTEPPKTMIDACARPAAPAPADFMSPDLRAKTFLRLFALAFRCDLTRYASFALSNGYNSRMYPELSTLNTHHQITHTGGKYGPDAPNVEMKFIVYFHGLMAFLLQELKSTPEGAGTLLDSCLIYFGSEMAEGYHTFDGMPVVLGGKAGGQLETGRHLRYPGSVPLSRLFLSILQLAGSTTKTFGTGGDTPLDGLKV